MKTEKNNNLFKKKKKIFFHLFESQSYRGRDTARALPSTDLLLSQVSAGHGRSALGWPASDACPRPLAGAWVRTHPGFQPVPEIRTVAFPAKPQCWRLDSSLEMVLQSCSFHVVKICLNTKNFPQFIVLDNILNTCHWQYMGKLSNYCRVDSTSI